MALLLIVGAVALASPSSASVVERTIDGDTLVISVGGHEERVRLLNIDTPETKDPSKPVQCLGPEAARLIQRLAPEGTQVELAYDVERRDRYGRLLASVRLSDGRSLSEELARVGLGVPIQVGANQAQYGEVAAAFELARAHRVGFFDPRNRCTVPAQYSTAMSALSDLPRPPEAFSGDVGGQIAAYVAMLEVARSFGALLSTPPKALEWAAMRPQAITRMASQLNERVEEVSRAVTRLKARRARLRAADARERARQAAQAAARRAASQAEHRRLEAAREAARQRVAAAREVARQRAEAERAARQRAEAQREAARQRAEAERAKQGSSSDGGGSNSGSYPGYTGPRCYDPGGVTWHPCP